MRIAIVSDIHGNLAALEAVVRDIALRGVDQVCNLGDSLSGPLQPKATAEFLMAQDWVQLAGNHERQVLNLSGRSSESDKFAHSQLGAAELQWMASLPSVYRLSADVLLCHGTPSSDCTGLLQTAERDASWADIEARLAGVHYPVIVCGHTHVPRMVRTRTGGLLVNPGSVGQPAFADDLPYPHVVETGSPDARYAIIEQQQGQWMAALYAVPYDAREMIALAQLRGRPDWAAALQTGYLS